MSRGQGPSFPSWIIGWLTGQELWISVRLSQGSALQEQDDSNHSTILSHLHGAFASNTLSEIGVFLKTSESPHSPCFCEQLWGSARR